MKGKGIITLSVIIIFLAIIFGGPYLFNAMLPHPKSSGFYTDGIYAKYEMQCMDSTIKKGYLIFNVDNHKLDLNITVYSHNAPFLYRNIIFNVSNDGNATYYHGKKVILPFFHGKGDIISYYNGSYVNVSNKDGPSISPFNRIGITKYRENYQYFTYNYILGKNGSVVEQGVHGDYEYGVVSSLLFYVVSFGHDPLFYHIANLSSNGVHYLVSLLLIDTNIQLAPPNYLALAAIYTIMMAPILLIIAVPAAAIYIYKYMKERKEREEE